MVRADNWGNFRDFIEAKVGWPVTVSNATLFTAGELWDAFLFTQRVLKDTTRNNFRGYNWLQLMDNWGAQYMECSLWLATGAAT